MQAEELKRRLSQLKKASIELKSKVLNQPKINYQFVSDIISTILPQKPEEQPIPSSQVSASPDTSSMKKSKRFSNYVSSRLSSDNSIVNSQDPNSIFVVPPSVPSQAIAATPAIQIKPVTDRMSYYEHSESNASLYSKETQENEIERLKQQNEEIEMQIQAVGQELSQLRKKELVLEEQAWKENVPFLHEQASLGIFMTKLYIKEYDYDKIDYEEGQMEIVNDKVIILLPVKPVREYKLANLSEVKYIGDKNMKIGFKIDETMFVFLQFDSKKQRDQWDLALFANSKIIGTKQLDKNLFVEGKQEGPFHLTKISKTSKSKSSLRQGDDGEGRAIEIKMSGTLNEHARKNSLKASEKRSLVSKGSQASFKREDSSKNGDYTLGHTSHFLESNQYLMGTTENSPHLEIPEKQFKDIVVFSNIGDSSNESRTNTSKFNSPDINFQSLDTYGPPDNELRPPPPSLSNDKKQWEREIMRWSTIVAGLKEGFYFTKYSKDALQPHSKKVYLSENEQQFICASTTDSSNLRVIPIEDIRKVSYPAIGEGVRRFLKDAAVQYFCLIEYKYHGAQKVMELGCQNIKFIARFAEFLAEFIKGRKFISNH